MDEHDFYNDVDVEDMDGIDDEDDLWDLEGEADLSTPAGIVAAVPAAVAGGAVGTGLYDLRSAGYNKLADWTGLSKYQPVRWLTQNSWNPASTPGSYLRDASATAGSGIAGAAIALLMEDADPFEPEFSSEDIDRMEALAEEAAEADGEDAILAADEMVSRLFGVMRASARMRPIIAALRDQARRIVLTVKRNPQHKLQARVAPLALRRTTATLMQMTAARRPIDSRTALMIFGRTMSELMQSPQGRPR